MPPFTWKQDFKGFSALLSVSSRDFCSKQSWPRILCSAAPVCSVAPPHFSPSGLLFLSPCPALTLFLTLPQGSDGQILHPYLSTPLGQACSLCLHWAPTFWGLNPDPDFLLAGLESFWSCVQVQSLVQWQWCLGVGDTGPGLWQRGASWCGPCTPWRPQECCSKLVCDSMEGDGGMAALDGASGSSVSQCRPPFLVSGGASNLSFPLICLLFFSTWLTWAPKISLVSFCCVFSFQERGPRLFLSSSQLCSQLLASARSANMAQVGYGHF